MNQEKKGKKAAALGREAADSQTHRPPHSAAFSSSELAQGPSAHGSARPAASTPPCCERGCLGGSGPLPASQLLLGNLAEPGHPSSTPLLKKRVQGGLGPGGGGVLLGGLWGGRCPLGVARRCLCLWERTGGKDAPQSLTVDHHGGQQALLLAAQPVVRLALLVPEAGQALGAGQALADGVLHAGAQAVRAPGPGAGGKGRVCVNPVNPTEQGK